MSKVPVAFDDIPVAQTPVQWYGGSSTVNSFDDLSKVSGTMSYGVSNNLASESFEDEPPLLEELGINPGLVLKKAITVLNPLAFDPKLLSESDTSGLFLSLSALGFFHLLVRPICRTRICLRIACPRACVFAYFLRCAILRQNKVFPLKCAFHLTLHTS
jgi:hypothetical protein